MSTVNNNVFPQIKREINQLQKEVLPEGVHALHLIKLCKSQEVSSIGELKEAIYRVQGPWHRNYLTSSAFFNYFWINSFGSFQKLSEPVIPASQWQRNNSGPDTNIFRIALIYNDTNIGFGFSEEILREEEDAILIYKNRMKYITDLIESQLAFLLLVERGLEMFGAPYSYAGVLSQTIMGLSMIEPGSANFYFMLPAHHFGQMLRQVPPRAGGALHMYLRNPSNNLNFIPIPQVNIGTPWTRNYLVGYSDYLVKTTTRYFMDSFRVERLAESTVETNKYRVFYERYVSYSLPAFVNRSSTSSMHTWAIVCPLDLARAACNIDEILSVGDDEIQIDQANITSF